MTHEVLQHFFFVFSIVVLVAGSLFWSFLESVITQLFCFFVTPGWHRESLLESFITQLFCFVWIFFVQPFTVYKMMNDVTIKTTIQS